MNRMRSTAIFFTTILSLLALPLLAQVNDTYVIPVAGNTPGAYGTHWATQFSLFNPQTHYPLKISVTFVPTGGARGQEALFTVPANSVAYSDNIVADLFDLSGTGSLLVAAFASDNPSVPNDALSRSFLVTTNTYNNASSGTYGQTIPGVWSGLQDFRTDSISAVAHGIRNIQSLGWRTNIGAVNLGDSSVTLRVSVYDVDGHTLLNAAPFYLPPLGHIQDALPVQVDRGSIEFWVDDPSQQAVVFPYASTIDQLSGDPTYSSPVLLASAKSLFGKTAATPAQPRKIDSSYLEHVRATANHLGEFSLQRTEKGLQIKAVR